jgi:hypothetical protein
VCRVTVVFYDPAHSDHYPSDVLYISLATNHDLAATNNPSPDLATHS